MGGGTKFFSLMLAMLIGTAGCAKGVPSDFYVLHAATSDSLVGAERGVAVGVGPVEVPAYLNRSQIVTRATDYELYLSESHQWAEPLKENISRVIAINLSNMLESNRVFVIPRRQKVTLDFQVAVDIARFDGQLGESAYLGARWTLYGSDTREPLLSKVAIINERTDDNSYNALVAAGSRALQALSLEIAEAINTRR
jgi:uncharacterized protein